MNRKLLWRLCLSISLVGVILVYLINELSIYIERQMSYIAKEYQSELRTWGDQAESLIASGDREAATRWLDKLRDQEQVFAAILQRAAIPLTDSPLTEEQSQRLSVAGRSLEYPIHLYHANPVMQVPFKDAATVLLIELPQRMRPGQWWPATHLFLHLILPVMILITLSMLIYRHLMRPLRQLQTATRSFSEGDYSIRARPSLPDRDDELTRLADTFDQMAERTGKLIETQRQLLGDLSHELRTPLTRLELAIDCSGDSKQCQHSRMQREARLMRNLVEDTLTIAWLQNEAPCLRQEAVNLTALLEAIVDDARFEFPDHTLMLEVGDDISVEHSSERALWQANENILRNALRHTPAGGKVKICVVERDKDIAICTRDQGPGIPEEFRQKIFKPFFRIDKSRERQAGGFGLGLALADRQIRAVGGTIEACNLPDGGLEMRVLLPH